MLRCHTSDQINYLAHVNLLFLEFAYLHMTVSPEVIYHGKKYFWRIKTSIDFHIIEHKELLILEIIAYNTRIRQEAPRLHVSIENYSFKKIGRVVPLIHQKSIVKFILQNLVVEADDSNSSFSLLINDPKEYFLTEFDELPLIVMPPASLTKYTIQRASTSFKHKSEDLHSSINFFLGLTGVERIPEMSISVDQNYSPEDNKRCQTSKMPRIPLYRPSNLILCETEKLMTDSVKSQLRRAETKRRNAQIGPEYPTRALHAPDNQHILIVDDMLPNRKVMRHMIVRRLEQLMDEASSGLHAVQMARERMESTGKPYDLILMDFYMPGMDGPTACREILSNGYTGPIVGFSFANDCDVDLFMSSGAFTVLDGSLSINLIIQLLNGEYSRKSKCACILRVLPCTRIYLSYSRDC